MGLLRDMREVFRTLRRRGASKKYCPKCGSPDIRLSRGSFYSLAPLKYVCRSCGYTGPIFMELEKEES